MSYVRTKKAEKELFMETVRLENLYLAAAKLAGFEDAIKAANSGTRYDLVGINKYGIEVYETSQDTMRLTWDERKKKYLDLMKNEYRGRTAKFTRNGHVYYATFDQNSLRKPIYGERRSSHGGTNAIIKAGADGDIFEVTERAAYRGSEKNKKDHTNADYFDYFVKTVQIDNRVFDVIIDVEKQYGKDGGLTYTLALEENKKIEASPAMGQSPLNPAEDASNGRVAQERQNVKPFSEKSEKNLSEDRTRNSLSPVEEAEETTRYALASPSEQERLNKEKTVTVYRAMQEIDGKLYPPMAAIVDAKLQTPSEIGMWYVSDEHPELIKFDENGKPFFRLNKGTGTPIDARYNPYFHTSLSPLNDQFTSAYKRDNLVVVEGEIPASELTSGYRAQYAKDAVGEVKWHSGTVSAKLAKSGKTRRVILSRWFKPVRVLTNTEVAQSIKELIGNDDIAIPYNVVTPSLRAELEKAGVTIEGDETRYSLGETPSKAYGRQDKVFSQEDAKNMVRELNAELNSVS